MSATPYEANRSLAYCSRMLNLAATDWGLREGNPCTGIKRFPERKRERFFSDGNSPGSGTRLWPPSATTQRHPASFCW